MDINIHSKQKFSFLVNISEHRTSSGTLFCFEILLTLRSAVTPPLIHWGQVTHICVGNLTIIGSDIGLLPGRHQAIIWTNDEIFLIESLGTNFSEILIEIQTFSLKKIYLKMLSAKCCRFRLGLKVLLQWNSTSVYTSCTYSTYHLELALGTFICHFITACLVCHTS